MSYEKGELEFGSHWSAEEDQGVFYLPHSCDEWVLGTEEDINVFLEDLSKLVGREIGPISPAPEAIRYAADADSAVALMSNGEREFIRIRSMVAHSTDVPASIGKLVVEVMTSPGPKFCTVHGGTEWFPGEDDGGNRNPDDTSRCQGWHLMVVGYHDEAEMDCEFVETRHAI